MMKTRDPQAAPAPPCRGSLLNCMRKESFSSSYLWEFNHLSPVPGLKRRMETLIYWAGVSLLRSVPGSFRREAEISNFLVLKHFGWCWTQPVTTMRKCPPRAPPHPERPSCKQASVHQQASLQNKIHHLLLFINVGRLPTNGTDTELKDWPSPGWLTLWLGWVHPVAAYQLSW